MPYFEGWKRDVQLRDLSEQQGLIISCQRCGFNRKATKGSLCASPERELMTIEDVEVDCICMTTGCLGKVKISMHGRHTAP
ncbi:hypothetical protein GGE16_004064 [Rhizobium leguminosarum]|uniref:Uncharacterized protein n=1 Tax=Rhizobium leguminosarum TaxID=384 RepID=A0AAE2SYV9_RHILE|nr:hypothetical protein [Rhizobium leguminosarum]MBB4433988.1 hypothetical protein [Rhizobium esperanzae]MBB4310074.1 hypothetical protein [Rhizobium leguminosarum]MBB4419185.1 hypothetical protein [Rhizobium leguminosarum]MBB4531232.1 hypothetical protein [Rhizobium leguminosarum]